MIGGFTFLVFVFDSMLSCVGVSFPFKSMFAFSLQCFQSLQEKVKQDGKVVKQEVKEREVVETQINSVKSWVQETKEYLGNPTIEIDAQLEELKVQNSFPMPFISKKKLS